MSATRSERYHAIPNPDDPQEMTYWRTNRGGLDPWPKKSTAGPTLTATDIPADLTRDQRSEWIQHWFWSVRGAWLDQVHAALAKDPELAQARFAMLQLRCAMCGRKLLDPASVVDAVGPDCRRQLSEAELDKLRTAVRVAHATAVLP